MIQATLITEGLKIVKSAKSKGHTPSPNHSSKFKNSKENKTKYTNGKENGTQNKVNRHLNGEENGTQNRHTDREVTTVQNTRRGTEKCQEMVKDLIDNKVSLTYSILTKENLTYPNLTLVNLT